MFLVLLQETFNENVLQGRPSKQIGEVEAEKVWRQDVSLLFGKDATGRFYNRCEHERLQPKCPRQKDSSVCTYRWAVTECLLVTGEMSRIARDLENRFDTPIQMGKVTWKDNADGTTKSAAGLLISYENCTFRMKLVFHSLKYDSLQCNND